MKKVITIFMLLVFAVSSTAVSAKETDYYTPTEQIEEYSYISEVNCSISSNNGKIYPSAFVKGKGSYNTSITLTLQVKSGDSWTNVTKWKESKQGTHISINKSYSCTKGKLYRAVCKAVVNNESVEKFSQNIIGR